MKEHFDHRESAELVKEIDLVAHRAMGGRERVFDDLLTMAVCALAGGTLEEEYLGVVRAYAEGQPGQRDVDRLAAVFARLVETMEETRADILGDVFQGAIARGRHGQFFTPEHLCELMTRMTDDGSGATVGDPCCGSGRMLLAAAKINRNREFVGQDADLRCVKIAAINLALHNLYGHVIWGNSLANERKLVYRTGFNGVGVIRLLPREEVPQAPAPPPASPAPVALKQGLLFEDAGS